MSSVACLLSILLGVSIAIETDEQQGGLFRSSGFVTLDSLASIATHLNVDEISDEISITISGPAAVYFAVSFGSHIMKGAWAIVATGGDNGEVFELLMGEHTAGDRVPSTFSVVSNTVSGAVRTVKLSRTVSAQEIDLRYHQFVASQAVVAVSYAHGSKPQLSYHSEFWGATDIPMTVTVISADNIADEPESNSDANAQPIASKSELESGWLNILNQHWAYFYGSSSISLMFVSATFVAVLFYALWRHFYQKKSVVGQIEANVYSRKQRMSEKYYDGYEDTPLMNAQSYENYIAL